MSLLLRLGKSSSWIVSKGVSERWTFRKKLSFWWQERIFQDLGLKAFGRIAVKAGQEWLTSHFDSEELNSSAKANEAPSRGG